MAIEDADIASVEQFTIPLLIPDLQSGSGSGTGVLVELQGNFYIFTAGHCVTAWEETKEGDVLKLSLNGETVSVPILHASFEKEGLTKDFGVFKLPSDSTSIITRHDKYFLSEERLEKSSPTPLEPVFIAGYPGLRLGIASLNYMGFKGNIHPQIDTRYPERFRVCVSREELEKVATPNDPWLDANSRGISGGGCWVIRERQGQTVSCLTATHYNSDVTGTLKFEAQLENHMRLVNEM
jgi:hypothetical protein